MHLRDIARNLESANEPIETAIKRYRYRFPDLIEPGKKEGEDGHDPEKEKKINFKSMHSGSRRLACRLSPSHRD